MQPFFSRTSLPSVAAGSAVGWSAAGHRHRPSNLADDAAEAGVGLLPRDEDDTARPRLDMRLGKDLQTLLGIQPEPETPVAQYRSSPGAPAPHRVARESAIENAADLLARRLEEARRLLSRDDMRTRLQRHGLSNGDIELELRLQSQSMLRTLRVFADRGEVVFPMVPSALALLDTAINAADLSALVANRPLLSTTGAITARIASTVAAVVEPEPHIDLARRAKALERLAAFQSRYWHYLPQVGNRALHGLWDLMQGNVRFLNMVHLISTFPCAISVTGGNGERYSVIYPQGDSHGTHVREAVVRGSRPVLVARSEKAPVVRICTDGIHWQDTTAYTDDVVEAAKLVMWRNVLAAGNTVYQRILEGSLWGI